jgi:hypothetical protein
MPLPFTCIDIAIHVNFNPGLLGDRTDHGDDDE